jgi:hypothetical protein
MQQLLLAFGVLRAATAEPSVLLQQSNSNSASLPDTPHNSGDYINPNLLLSDIRLPEIPSLKLYPTPVSSLTFSSPNLRHPAICSRTPPRHRIEFSLDRETQCCATQPELPNNRKSLGSLSPWRPLIMARVYADVNANMPRSYWDYDSVNIAWGALENYEVVRKIGMSGII